MQFMFKIYNIIFTNSYNTTLGWNMEKWITFVHRISIYSFPPPCKIMGSEILAPFSFYFTLNIRKIQP
jgi:hypothetical protein